jgi:hypothetical protein
MTALSGSLKMCSRKSVNYPRKSLRKFGRQAPGSYLVWSVKWAGAGGNHFRQQSREAQERERETPPQW